MTSARKRTPGAKQKGPYTKGELNKAVDALVKPLAREGPIFLLIDEVAHMLIEQNPQESAVKFVRYTLAKIIKKLLEETN